MILPKAKKSLRMKAKKNEFISKLEKLYNSAESEDSTKFRHFYSDIFSVVSEIKDGKQKGDLEILGSNISALRGAYKCIDTSKDITKNLSKLDDHVSLDIARVNYYTDSYYNKAIAKIDALNDVSSKVAGIEEKLNKEKKRLKKIHIDNIAILGIFCAVIMSFFGGFYYSDSILENMKDVSLYRIVFIMLILGFILVNILWVLFSFISKLIGNEEKFFTKQFIFFTVVILVALIIVIVYRYSSFFGAA